jgi:hypothetical protein
LITKVPGGAKARAFSQGSELPGQEVAEGAIVHAVKVQGVVADFERVLAGVRFVEHGFHQGRPDEQEAVLAPGAMDHLLDEVDLGFVGGPRELAPLMRACSDSNS